MNASVLAGRYRLQERIGGGGMAEVYKAVDEVLGRTVAVKVMREQLAGDTTWQERFRREARAAAALNSQHIVTVYDWGHDGDLNFIVMEFIEGEDLGALIRREAPLAVERVARIGSQAADALAEAHEHGVIHRDVSPGNILVDSSGSAKMTDFGIAWMGSTALTQTGTVLGSASYLSPEQAQGLGASAASDIYSLGVVLFEAATGRPPFEGDGPIAIAYQHVNEPPPRPHDVFPHVDGWLEEVILKAIQKAPDARYPSAAEMRDDLLGLMGPRMETMPGLGATLPATTLRDPTPVAKTAVMAVQPAASKGSSSAPHARWVRAYALAVVLLAALLLVLGWGAIDYERRDDTPPPVVAPDIVVPAVVGLAEEEARAAIVQAGLEPVPGEHVYSPDAPAGTVIAQDPAAGDEAQGGAAVHYVLSLGPAPSQGDPSSGDNGEEGKAKGRGRSKDDKD